MICDGCKNIPVLTRYPCQYCGRLNVEAELAAKQLEQLRKPRAPRLGGDGVDIARRHWDELTRAGFQYADYVILDEACVEAYAAGRARGIEEERRRCIHIVMARHGRWTKLADGARDYEDRNRQNSMASECGAIADAIAKETGK